MARTVSGVPLILIMLAPPSFTKRIAASGNAVAGRSQLSSARFTPRRTALQTMRSSSTVTSFSVAWPQRFLPTESPTDTRSTPARSAICAIGVSQATTPTILRPWRFISCIAERVIRSMVKQYTKRPMIIDIQRHYTSQPQTLLTFRDKQLAGLADAMRKPANNELGITDEHLVQRVQPQLMLQRDRCS